MLQMCEPVMRVCISSGSVLSKLMRLDEYPRLGQKFWNLVFNYRCRNAIYTIIQVGATYTWLHHRFINRFQ